MTKILVLSFTFLGLPTCLGGSGRVARYFLVVAHGWVVRFKLLLISREAERGEGEEREEGSDFYQQLWRMVEEVEEGRKGEVKNGLILFVFMYTHGTTQNRTPLDQNKIKEK